MLDGYSAPDLLYRKAASHARQLFLVTGGCGFIGSHLAEALVARGDVVRVLDDLSHGKRENLPRGVEFIEGDLADPVALRRAIQDVDGCFHLAAVSSIAECHARWLDAHRINLTGTISVFDAARRGRHDAPVPVVYASSAAVYGEQGAIALSESLMPRPISAAGADKAGCELHAKIAQVMHRVPTIGLRFFNVYGPRQDTVSPHAAAVPNFCRGLADRRPISLFGDGGQLRDFVYVKDAVAALLAAMDHGSRQAEIFNVCTGRGVTVAALAQTIARIVGVTREIDHRPARPSDMRHALGDPARAHDALGIEASTDLETGLRLTLKSYAAAGVV